MTLFRPSHSVGIARCLRRCLVVLYSTFPGRASTVTCVVVQTDLRRPRDQPYLCRQPSGRRKCPLMIISPSRALQHLDGHAGPGDVIGRFAWSKPGGSKGLPTSSRIPQQKSGRGEGDNGIRIAECPFGEKCLMSVDSKLVTAFFCLRPPRDLFVVSPS